MGMQANLLKNMIYPRIGCKVGATPIRGGDPDHRNMRNWMDSAVRAEPHRNALVEAGYNHSISNIMTTGRHCGPVSMLLLMRSTMKF